MPRDFSRTLRVSEQIKRLLAVLVRDGIKDPRVGMVTIADVEVSNDLSHARVYVTVMNMDAEQAAGTVEALNHAAGFLRHELGRQMNIRTLPALRFFYDDVQEQGNRIESLIGRAVSKDRGQEENS